jgi:DNA-directed RNA polymerase specialized sigma24 family protein
VRSDDYHQGQRCVPLGVRKLSQLEVRTTHGGVSARDHAVRTALAPRAGLSSDAALASRVRHGDRRALRALYGRYAGEIFDFAAPLTGPPTAAAVVADTFTTAWDRLRLGVRPPRVEPWLLGIAHAAALGRADGRHVTWPEAVGGGRAHEEGAAASARRWAETLTPRDYALVDLYIRRGLSVRELSVITGLAEQAVRDRVDRLAGDLERFAATDLVLRRPASCAGLSVLLDRFLGADDAARRRAVRQHARLCDACGAAAGRAGSSLAAFAELPSAPWQGDTGGATWAAIAAHAAGNVAPGKPRSTATRGLGRSHGLVAAAAAGICVAGLALVVALDPFGGSAGERRASPSNEAQPQIGNARSVFEPPVTSTPSGAKAAAQQGTAGAGQEAGNGAGDGSPAAKAKQQSGRQEGDGTQKPEKAGQAGQKVAKPEQAGSSAKPAAPATSSQADKPAQQAPPAAPQAKPATPQKAAPAALPPRARTLAWAPVNGAAGYELVLQRDGQEVFKTRIREARAVLPAAWSYNGRPMKLQAGYYAWFVWPLEQGQRRAEQAVVVSSLHID